MSVLPDKMLTFEVNGEEYVFSGYTGLLVRSSTELQNGVKNPSSISDVKIVKYLFGSNMIDKKKRVSAPSETRLQNITVFVTNRCNLKCSYCYERANDAIDNRDMSLDTFKVGMQFFLSQFNTAKRINILFFGGEPFMNMPLVRDAVNHLKRIEKNEGIQFSYSVTTNGTIMNESILDLLIENNFSVIVSIDGLKENHDYYRPFINGRGSHQRILNTIGRVSRYKKVVARVTLNDMDTDIVRLYEDLTAAGIWEVHVTIVSKKYTENYKWEETFKPLRQRIKEMEDYFLKSIRQRRVVRYCDLLKYLKLIHFGWKSNGNAKIFPCSAGYSSFSLATNGDIYLCHRFNNIAGMKLGNIREGMNLERRTQFLGEHHISERQGACNPCWAAAFCGGTCYHTTFSTTGETNPINNVHCVYTKEMVKSALNIYVSISPEQRYFLENIN